MALSKSTLDAIAAAVAAALAQAPAAAQVSVPTPAAPKAPRMVTVTLADGTIVTGTAVKAEGDRSADGRDFPCTVTPSCGRMLRSTKRAAIHGVEAGGHTPATV